MIPRPSISKKEVSSVGNVLLRELCNYFPIRHHNTNDVISSTRKVQLRLCWLLKLWSSATSFSHLGLMVHKLNTHSIWSTLPKYWSSRPSTNTMAALAVLFGRLLLIINSMISCFGTKMVLFFFSYFWLIYFSNTWCGDQRPWYTSLSEFN